MKICRILVFFIFLLLFNLDFAFSFGKKDTDKTSQEENSNETQNEIVLQKEFLKIDWQIDFKSENPKNHFDWSTLQTSNKDHFDVVSGASKNHSTKKLREFALTFPVKTDFSQPTPGKNFLVPKGLYALMLFPVSKNEYLKTDEFTISKLSAENGNKKSINFTHRGIKYRIEIDENDEISVPESFFVFYPESMKKDGQNQNGEEGKNDEVSEKSEKISEESKKEDEKGGEKSEKKEETAENQEKTDENMAKDGEFLQEIYNESLEAAYFGKLRVKFNTDGILKISGKLKIKKIEKIAPPSEESPEETPPPTEDNLESDEKATAS